MLFLTCFCDAFVHVWLLVPCGNLLGKGWPPGSHLWCLIVKVSLSHWYPGSGVVLDCIDSWFLPYFVLCHPFWNKRALGPWVAQLRMTDQWSGIICEILVEFIMRNNSVKLFWIWVRDSWEDIVLKISYLELWQSSFGAAEPFMQFWKRASWVIFMWSYIEFGPVVQKEMSF